MRLRNETANWSNWMPVASTASWTLSSGDGRKQVSLQAEDAAGNLSSVVSAGILLDTTPPTVSLSINGGATETNQPVVTLTISIGGAISMRLRNETANWSDWMPVASTVPWALSSGDGQKQVSLQAQDAAGNLSSVVSAGILLDTTPPQFTFNINGGATTTTTPQVTLSTTGTAVAQVRFCNQGSSWSNWMPAGSTTTWPWTLSAGDGLKQVSAQAQDTAGNTSGQVSATITLDPTPVTGLALSIDGGAARTLVDTVTLTIAATGATEMRFCNENGAWSDWEPFATTKQWTLSSGRATKTVSVQGQDAAGLLSTTVSASIIWGGFDDIPTNFWDYAQVMACVDANIVRGYDDNTYRPGQAVDRDQMAIFIARALVGGLQCIPTYAGLATFTDVPSDYWAYNEIEYCFSHQVAQGYPDGYHPAEVVDRAQMAVFVRARKREAIPGW